MLLILKDSTTKFIPEVIFSKNDPETHILENQRVKKGEFAKKMRA